MLVTIAGVVFVQPLFQVPPGVELSLVRRCWTDTSWCGSVTYVVQRYRLIIVVPLTGARCSGTLAVLLLVVSGPHHHPCINSRDSRPMNASTWPMNRLAMQILN